MGSKPKKLREGELRRLKMLATIKETAGAWTEESHPELRTDQDIERYLEESRAAWRLP